MNGRVVAGTILFLLVVVALVGLGIYVYQIGMAQGIAQADKLPASSIAPVPGPYGVAPYFYRPWGFGLGCFGILIPILFVVFLFSVMRTAFSGGHWRRRAWMTNEHVPPMFEEWHKKAHEKQS